VVGEPGEQLVQRDPLILLTDPLECFVPGATTTSFTVVVIEQLGPPTQVDDPFENPARGPTSIDTFEPADLPVDGVDAEVGFAKETEEAVELRALVALA